MRHPRTYLLFLLCLAFAAPCPPALAQNIASVSGVITDASGGAVAAAKISAKNGGTQSVRTTISDSEGRYLIPDLQVGEYEVTVTKNGFQTLVHTGIDLVVNQRAMLDFKLQVGEVRQQITVTGDVSLVNTTTTDISGLVRERQVKNLPLNGRSYDLLTLLNPGVANFTWQKTGGIGISNSTTANMFSVSGNRPQQNLFLLNGIEYTGAAENNMTPGGASGQLLGIDAVREFNTLRNDYGAEYGKKPGGQITIVTQSGTNQWHGSIFEFLRNSALDAPNFFDADSTTPPFRRNQFGAALGGPIRKDRTFLFANYEGFRQSLNETSVAFVPDAQSRLDAAAVVKNMGLLNLWPVAPPGAPDFKVTATGDGVAQFLSSPLQTIHEDFGTFRMDHVFSQMDSASGVYTVDDSFSNTATPLDPFSTDLLGLREQVASIQETHIFSPTLLSTARFGYSRAGYFFTGEPTPGTPAATVPGFLSGLPVGAVVVGGSQASNPQAQLGLAGSNNGSNLHVVRNLYSVTDDVSLSKGRHQLRFGIWMQPFQSNEIIALSQFGQLTFTGLPNFLAGTASFLYDPTPSAMGWRSFFGAWYAEDVVRVRPNLTVSLGFRAESSTGWSEKHGLAGNYMFAATRRLVCSSQPASNICLPQTGKELFTKNRATFLPEPRLGIAWSPLGQKTVIRAGFGMYHDLQDALGYRADQNAPANPTFTIGATSLSNIFVGGNPIQRNAPPPTSPLALLLPGGVQPDLFTPTLISYSLAVQREITPNMSVSIGYVGNHGYHEIIGADANAPVPVVCPASPCPATFPVTINPATGQPVFGALAGHPVPAGTFFNPTSTKPNTALANTWTWFSEGTSNYNALQLDVNKRFNSGLAFRGVYTWSKTLDNGDSLNATAAQNAVALLSNPYDTAADKGLATYDVRNLAAINATYLLPFGQGRRYAAHFTGIGNGFISGWSLNSIVTSQSGFPFTPQLGYNPSNNGDTRNPVRPSLNPAFAGKIVTGDPNQWFNPAAFISPPSNSGFYGNLGRDTFIGPGLATWDLGISKDTRIGERLNLQFRAEIFNLLNRANFNTPTLVLAVLQAPPNNTIPEPSPTAGQITSTSTSSRQIQFGLKLLF